MTLRDPSDVRVAMGLEDPRVRGLRVHRERQEAGVVPPDEVEPVDYSELSKRELKDLAKERGLPVSGSKSDLIARLEA